MKSLQGHLLIASPQLLDPNFFRTVVLMVQHSDGGALGLVLNYPLDITIQSAWEQVSDQPCEIDGPLFRGGPCEGPLMVLHTDPEASQMEIVPGVHFSTDKEAIERLVDDGHRPIKFFVGYAGWSAGQLEKELAEGSWLIAPADRPQIFEGGEEQWIELRKELSRAATLGALDPKLIPDDPSVN